MAIAHDLHSGHRRARRRSGWLVVLGWAAVAAHPKNPTRPSSSPAAPAPAPASSPPLLSVRLRVLGGGEVALGPGKAELLAAVADTGSITGAAKRLNVSYMHAWSLIQTMNRCFRAPLVLSSRGGRRGGGAGLTPEGAEVLALYRAMAAEALRAAQTTWERLRPKLHGADAAGGEEFALASSTAEEDDGELMEQSIRNELPGTVKEIVSDKVLSEVLVETASGEVAAVITTRSVQEMGLKVGDKVAALVKATNVSVRREG